MPKYSNRKITLQTTIRVYDDTTLTEDLQTAFATSGHNNFNEFCAMCLRKGLKFYQGQVKE